MSIKDNNNIKNFVITKQDTFILEKFKNTITSMRETAKKNNLDKLTLDDINDIINKTRKGRKK